MTEELTPERIRWLQRRNTPRGRIYGRWAYRSGKVTVKDGEGGVKMLKGKPLNLGRNAQKRLERAEKGRRK